MTENGEQHPAAGEEAVENAVPADPLSWLGAESRARMALRGAITNDQLGIHVVDRSGPKINILSVEGRTVTFSYNIPCIGRNPAFEAYSSIPNEIMQHINNPVEEWIGLYVHDMNGSDVWCDRLCLPKSGTNMTGTTSLIAPCDGVFDIRVCIKNDATEGMKKLVLNNVISQGGLTAVLAPYVVPPLLLLEKSQVHVFTVAKSDSFTVGPEMHLETRFLDDAHDKIVVTWDRSIETRNDRLGLYFVDEKNNKRYITYLYASSSAGDEGLTFDIPEGPGRYEVRYFFGNASWNGTYAYSGRSNPFCRNFH